MFRALILCVAIATAILFAQKASARDNKGQVQASLRAKHDKVIFGKHIDHFEYIKFLSSMAGGPAGVSVYLTELAKSIVTETGGQVATETIFDLLSGKQDSTIIGSKPVYIGVATYNHWTDEDWLGFKFRKPEPNTHHFYVAIGKKHTAQPVVGAPAVFAKHSNGNLFQNFLKDGKNWRGFQQIGADWNQFRPQPDGRSHIFVGADGWFYAKRNDGVLLRNRPTPNNNSVLDKYDWAGWQKLGEGWNAFDLIFQDREGWIYARVPNEKKGKLQRIRLKGGYKPDGQDWWSGWEEVGADWDQFTFVFAGNDGWIYTRRHDGFLYRYHYHGLRNGTPHWSCQFLGEGWNAFSQIFAASDGYIYTVTPTEKKGKLMRIKFKGFRDGEPDWSAWEEIGADWNQFDWIGG